MSYTKGPWSFNVVRKCRYIGGENHVEYELKDSEGKDIMPTIENVRLHAAAPELLEALEEMMGAGYGCVHVGNIHPCETCAKRLKKAYAAIAKARGEK